MVSNTRKAVEAIAKLCANTNLGAALSEAVLQNISARVPLITNDVAALLFALARLKSPQRVLEIGTGCGFSTLLMAAATQADIVTIENDPYCCKVAQALFDRAGVAHRIHLLCVCALDILPGLQGGFDLVFIDADKSQYPQYYSLVLPLLASNSLLVADDIYFSGEIDGQPIPGLPIQEIRSELARFRQMISDQPGVITSVLPLGCGISISVFPQELAK